MLTRPDKVYREMCESVRLSKIEASGDVISDDDFDNAGFTDWIPSGESLK